MTFNFPFPAVPDQTYGEYVWDGEKWTVVVEPQLLLETGPIVVVTDILLLESGGYLLLESGGSDYMLLETGGVVVSSGWLETTVGYIAANFNMITWGKNAVSTDFTNVDFAYNGASITTGFTGPDGSMLAQKLVEASGGGPHYGQSGRPRTRTLTPIKYRAACIAKAAERTRLVLTLRTSSLTTNASVGFDLAGGNVGYDTAVGSDTSLDAYAMTSLGGGWYLCQLDAHYTGAITSGGVSNVWEITVNIDNGAGTAARSTSYVGDGTSGVTLFWLNMLPTAAWPITNRVFFEDFDSLATIDLANTRAPGFNWYINNLMPNSFMTTFGWRTNPPSAPTAVANLSISSPSVLKIYNPNQSQNGYTSQIWSVADDGAGGYVGHAWKGPVVFDMMASWDGTSAGFSTNWAGATAFWSAAVECMTGNMGGATHFTEWDIIEGGSNAGDLSGGSTVHDWSNPSAPFDHAFGQYDHNSQLPGEFNRYSSIFLPTVTTGTTWGTYLFFFNGQHIDYADVAYGSTDVPQPLSTPGSPVGTLMPGDIQTYPILVNSAENSTTNPGGGWAMYIDWVKVYKG